MRLMSEFGLYTGINDKHDKPIQLGDTLSFDEKVWGRKYEFVLAFEDGELNIGFGSDDLSKFCEIIKKFDA